jgi:mRNA interferase MazF
VIRGAVYRIDLGQPRGHEQRGKRLGLVVSPSESPLSVVTVIPTSTSARPAIHRPELEIAGRLTRLLVDQIRSIDTDYLVGEPVDYLSRDQLAKVELALAHYLGITAVAPPRNG